MTTTMSEKELRLAEDLIPYVLDGSKRITIRKGRRFFDKEITIAGYPAVVESVEYYPLGYCPLNILQDDGFTGHADALEQMKRFYPDITEDTIVSVVRFHLV